MSGPFSPHITDSRRRLVLLAVHDLVCMAMDEFKILAEEIILAFKHDSAMLSHAEKFDMHLKSRTLHIQALRDEIKGRSRDVRELVVTASLDLSSTPQSFIAKEALEDNSDTIAQYAKDGHFGIACVLQLNRLMDLPEPPHAEVMRFLDYRKQLLVDVVDVVAVLDLRSSGYPSFDICFSEKTQLFIPRTICKIPAVKAEMRQDGRVDCLFRSVSQIVHDAGERDLLSLDLLDAESSATDGLGRSLLHLVALRSGDETVEGTAAIFLEDRTLALGLTALHIAAIKGHIQVFEILHGYGSEFIEHLQALSEPTGRACLHWAASCGQLQIVKLLGTLAGADFHKLINTRDRQGDTPLHLAARYGHTEIVRALLDSLPVTWNNLQIYRRHTPFWAAVSGGHLEIMKALMLPSNVDEDESSGLTPLAEAARNGFIDGVRYLLGLNGDLFIRINGKLPVNPNSLNSRWSTALKRSELKTPLDLAIEGRHDGCIRHIQENGGVTWEELTGRI
jgi:ankyrin repeat protein